MREIWRLFCPEGDRLVRPCRPYQAVSSSSGRSMAKEANSVLSNVVRPQNPNTWQASHYSCTPWRLGWSKPFRNLTATVLRRVWLPYRGTHRFCSQTCALELKFENKKMQVPRYCSQFDWGHHSSSQSWGILEIVLTEQFCTQNDLKLGAINLCPSLIT